ncbi:hypothetical protein [Rhodoferax sp. GW822-FHT02A01]|uniref:hypothetical protein n=1 Tax=Rhodoferax sp. GW822-FHT02A01 TaxID=3141537 RepID=UPI00315D096B
MAIHPNRLTVTLDEDSIALLREVELIAGLSPAQTVAKLWPSHLEDLWDYVTWFKQLPPGPSKLRSLAPNLLLSYGPEPLREGIRKIDPSYQTEGELFAATLKEAK